MSDSTTYRFISHSISETIRAGQQLGALLHAGDVVCLSGDLGAGKTALTQGIGSGWGAQEPVTSPTFTLVHEHRRASDALVLYHVDCYRLQGAADAWSIGLEDLLAGSDVIVLEWPENVADVLPAERLWIDLTLVSDTARQLTAHASGGRYQTLLATLREHHWGR